ncbi:hypothetical protein JMJ56_30415 [Belnapia sp. T18]|uniref:Uracil DNA glycosylase superfamily protein n=1 Tax=Belnapia arida TaxID=2804533 RepID=A0ABS1UC81_9PROT|nr:hypothetical protein [Belnapia arida]MBL6082293.1 hypothetical protein [Belnapia arida]
MDSNDEFPAEVLRVVRDMLGGTTERLGIADLPGTVLFSGRDTLKRGNLYIMGLNPGGEEKGLNAIEGTIGQSLDKVQTNWNSYADEGYAPSGGPNELQRRIRSVFEALGADPRQTFTTNAVFARAPGVQALTQRVGSPWNLWWDHCWPIHQLFLRIVRPRVIICFGNGGPPEPSTFELLRLTNRTKPYRYNWPLVEDETAQSGKLHEGVELDIGEKAPFKCTVFGLPHPSTLVHSWPLNADAARWERVTRARALIVGWERESSASVAL